jgi:hypothetical protein
MAVYKVKRFNQPQQQGEQPTARELQMEQMKLQRQLLINQRAKSKAMQQERETKIRMQMQARRLEERKDEEINKKVLQAQKMTQKRTENDDTMPPSLVKNRTKPTGTVSVNK